MMLMENKIFANEEAFLALDKEGFIVLPKAAAFTDAVSEVQEEYYVKRYCGLHSIYLCRQERRKSGY